LSRITEKCAGFTSYTLDDDKFRGAERFDDPAQGAMMPHIF